MDLRIARPADGPALLEIYGPVVESTSISFEEEPPSGDEMGRRVERTLARHPWLVAEDAEGVLGYSYGTIHRERAAYRWSVEVSAYVHERARRRGVARTLYEALFAILERQRYQRAWAGITLPNEASVALHESLGFRPVGVYRGIGFKAGTWHDVGWWGRDLGTPVKSPAEPILFPEFNATHDVAALLRR